MCKYVDTIAIQILAPTHRSTALFFFANPNSPKSRSSSSSSSSSVRYRDGSTPCVHWQMVILVYLYLWFTLPLYYLHLSHLHQSSSLLCLSSLSPSLKYFSLPLSLTFCYPYFNSYLSLSLPLQNHIWTTYKMTFKIQCAKQVKWHLSMWSLLQSDFAH